MSQICTLETLIGLRALYFDHVISVELMVNGINGSTTVMVLAWQVVIQINSEMNCMAKNKCPDNQKLDTRRRGENLVDIVLSIEVVAHKWKKNLNATSNSGQDQEHVYLCILCL